MENNLRKGRKEGEVRKHTSDIMKGLRTWQRKGKIKKKRQRQGAELEIDGNQGRGTFPPSWDILFPVMGHLHPLTTPCQSFYNENEERIHYGQLIQSLSPVSG